MTCAKFSHACRQQVTCKRGFDSERLRKVTVTKTSFSYTINTTLGRVPAYLQVHFILSWGVSGALVESTPFVRRAKGSTPALAAT